MARGAAALMAALLALGGAAAARAIPARDGESRREVLQVLDALARSMATRDTALLTSLFLPGARLVGIRTREGGPALQALTVREFADFLAKDGRERWIERLHDPEVRIDGTLATVWAGYDFSFGERRSHCGTDAFQLLRVTEGWRIASLADTYRTEGCR